MDRRRRAFCRIFTPKMTLFPGRLLGVRWVLAMVVMLTGCAQPVPTATAASPGGQLTAPCTPDERTTRVARLLQEVLDEITAAENVPSASVHVDAPRLCLQWSGVSGVRDFAGKAPLTADHPFRIASNTKTYTAAAVLRLYEEGRLALDDPIGKHLPDEFVSVLQPEYPVNEITIVQLLTHTAGLYDHGMSPAYHEQIFGDPTRRWTPLDQVRIAVRDGSPLGKPGSAHHYSDTGYVLLGTIVVKVSGKPWAEAVRTLLDFKGLGLRETWMESLEPVPANVPERAHQYLGSLDTHDMDPSIDLWGGGGIVTTARELAKFQRALHEGRVFKKAETLQLMLSTRLIENQRGYRLGIRRIEAAGRVGWGHTGFWNTFAYYFPEIDVAIAGSIMQQQNAPRGTEVAARMIRLVNDSLNSEE